MRTGPYAKVLCLGMSYPDITEQMEVEGFRSGILLVKKRSVKQVVECVRRNILTEMDGRDLARCMAMERKHRVEAYTVSQERGAAYNSSRHLHANFNRASFAKSLSKAFGKNCRFQQIILDYFWIPTGTWVMTHWSKSFFQQTLPDLASFLEPSREKHNSVLDHGVIFLPFCLHVFKEIISSISVLDQYYEISFVRKSQLRCHALWSGTSSIDPTIMQEWFGKKINQEDFYCTFSKRDLYQCMDDGGVTKDEVNQYLRKIEDAENVRMIRLKPLPSYERGTGHTGGFIYSSPPLSPKINMTNFFCESRKVSDCSETDSMDSEVAPSVKKPISRKLCRSKPTPKLTPKPPTKLIPKVTPKSTSKVIPKVTPKSTSKVTPRVTPKSTSKVTPRVTPKSTSKITTKSTPNLIPKSTSKSFPTLKTERNIKPSPILQRKRSPPPQKEKTITKKRRIHSMDSVETAKIETDYPKKDDKPELDTKLYTIAEDLETYGMIANNKKVSKYHEISNAAKSTLFPDFRRSYWDIINNEHVSRPHCMATIQSMSVDFEVRNFGEESIRYNELADESIHYDGTGEDIYGQDKEELEAAELLLLFFSKVSNLGKERRPERYCNNYITIEDRLSADVRGRRHSKLNIEEVAPELLLLNFSSESRNFGEQDLVLDSRENNHGRERKIQEAAAKLLLFSRQVQLYPCVHPKVVEYEDKEEMDMLKIKIRAEIKYSKRKTHKLGNVRERASLLSGYRFPISNR